METGTDVGDFAGLGKAAEKLIGEISKGIGTLYRPCAIRNEGKAEAATILAIELAKGQAEEQKKELALAGQLNRIALLVSHDPEIIARAKARLALQEIQGQLNIEGIADAAIKYMPEQATEEPLSDEWRQRFFKYAADVSTTEMQEIWAKLLAGEVAQPKSFAVRSLDVLHNLSHNDAVIFSRLSALCFNWPFNGPAKVSDENSAFGSFDVSYNDLMTLREAGLLSYADNIRMSFAPQAHITFRFHGAFINLVPNANSRVFLNLPLTQAGIDLFKAIKVEGNYDYLKVVIAEWLSAGYEPTVIQAPEEIKAYLRSLQQPKS